MILNTQYDATLKEKVFVLKGEEDYARTTDCILTEITHYDESGVAIDEDNGRRADWNHWLQYMKVEFRVEVLRDIGESVVALYDNDTMIGEPLAWSDETEYVEWKYESPSKDNRMNLAYDVEHNIYAKFMGNKKCLKSQSKTYTFMEATPDAYQSSLEIMTYSRYYTSPSGSFKVKLIAEEYVSGKSVEVYCDDTSLGTFTTDSSGLTSNITFPSNLTDGIHTFYAKFNGDDEINSSEVTKQVSVGLVLEDFSYPHVVVTGAIGTVKGKVVDYFGNGWGNEYISITDLNEGIPEEYASTRTTSDGSFVIDSFELIDEPWKLWISSYGLGIYSTTFIQPSTVVIEDYDKWVHGSTRLYGYVLDENNEKIEVDEIPITVSFYDRLDGEMRTKTVYTRSDNDYRFTFIYNASTVGSTVYYNGRTDISFKVCDVEEFTGYATIFDWDANMKGGSGTWDVIKSVNISTERLATGERVTGSGYYGYRVQTNSGFNYYVELVLTEWTVSNINTAKIGTNITEWSRLPKKGDMLGISIRKDSSESNTSIECSINDNVVYGGVLGSELPYYYVNRLFFIEDSRFTVNNLKIWKID